MQKKVIYNKITKDKILAVDVSINVDMSITTNIVENYVVLKSATFQVVLYACKYSE